MNTYRVATTSGVIDIEADTIRFEPGHVTFWRKVYSGAFVKETILVRAIHNPAVEEIREVES